MSLRPPFSVATLPLHPSRQRGLRRLRLRTYAEQISLDELPANTPVCQAGPIRFNSAACLLLLRRPPARSPALLLRSTRFFFFFFQSLSISRPVHDPVSPRRTIDPRLTSRSERFLSTLSTASLFFFSPFSLLPRFTFSFASPGIIGSTRRQDAERDYLGRPGPPKNGGYTATRDSDYYVYSLLEILLLFSIRIFPSSSFRCGFYGISRRI